MNYDLPGQIGFDGSTQEERVYQNAVERVRLAHESARGDKLHVAFSGGKDSTVLWAIVRDAAKRTVSLSSNTRSAITMSQALTRRNWFITCGSIVQI